MNEHIEAFQGIRKFLVNVGKLLQSSNTQMGKHGWIVPPRSSAVGSETSHAVDCPQLWLPTDAFQFYRSEKHFNVLAFVSVLFDDIRQPEKLEEPLVRAGYFVFKNSENRDVPNYDYGWCRVSLYELGVAPWNDIAPKILDPREYYNVAAGRIFSKPLLEITSDDQLLNDVVTPLLDELRKNFPPEI